MSERGPPTGESIQEFVNSLQDFTPATGFDCTDKRTLRLVSLATQRFLASILDEAINIHKRRRLAPAAQLRADGHDPRDKRVVLSTEELAEALKECGVNANLAAYYADSSKPDGTA
ncbi:hypothetical protein QBZ16_004742 [Prototheca wickerhamii]|uniref:Transcription initiation factor TFIID subunit 10 n=1 Tax=Prototheca wickerhamii TaxID=3111 RepID=A0AAD9IF73_PROWI|nr:hypothetical protein QBZ16_004742 [Prototheca wickerhamii]